MSGSRSLAGARWRAPNPVHRELPGREGVPSFPRLSKLAAGIAAALLLVPVFVEAQEDFRSLDAGRPIRVTDAYPIKFREWEFQFGMRGSLAEGGRGATGSFEIETGLFRNAEIGIEFEPGFSRAGGRSSSGIEGLGGHMTYNFNQESWSWPAFAVMLETEAPIRGSLGRQDWGFEATGIATRSFASRTRLHVNAGYASASRIDQGDYWIGGLAVDAPIGLFSRLIAGDVFVEVPVDHGRTRVLAEVGTRFQISNLSVIDFGIGSRIDEWADGRSNVHLVVGLSRVFGLRGMVRVPPYPNPRIN